MACYERISGHAGVQCTHRRDCRASQRPAEKFAGKVAKTGAQKATATGRIPNTRRTTGPAQTDICVLILYACFVFFFFCSQDNPQKPIKFAIYHYYIILPIVILFFFFSTKRLNNIVCFYK